MEIDLLKNYPKPKRDVKKRFEAKTNEDRLSPANSEENFLMGIEPMGTEATIITLGFGSR